MYGPWAIPNDPRMYANYLGVTPDAIREYEEEAEVQADRLQYATDDPDVRYLQGLA